MAPVWAFAAGLNNGQELKLYAGAAPAAKGEAPEDVPALRAYMPKGGKGTGAAVVVCPGGGYHGLAAHEGEPVARWLADNGIAAFVLRYRLGPKYHHPVELGDAQRAIRYVRSHGKDWGLDGRVGILGFSAGGHLASSAATHFDDGKPDADDPVERVSCRPDLQILIYPVITFTGPEAHKGSRKNLLGDNPDPALVDLLSNEKQVTSRTPPAFIVGSTQDTVVPVANCDMYAAALKAAGVPCEYLRGAYGQHGFGLKDFWSEPCTQWLRGQKF